MPPPSKPAGALAKVWSLSPASPGLLPPSQDLVEWRTARLTETGGAIITKDNTFVMWQEGKPTYRVKIDPSLGETMITTGTTILASGAKLGLMHFVVFRDPPDRVTEDVITAFDSAASGHIPLINRAGEIIAIGIPPQYTDLVTIPNVTGKPPKGLAMTSAQEVWSLSEQGQVIQHTKDKGIPRLDNATSIASTGTGILAMTEDGRVLALDAAPEPPRTITHPQQLITALGHAAVIDSKGKVTVWGPAVEDSPQRFQMPEGHKQLAISPKGVIATW